MNAGTKSIRGECPACGKILALTHGAGFHQMRPHKPASTHGKVDPLGWCVGTRQAPRTITSREP